MKQITYPTWGTCSKFINFELDEDHRVHNVQFLGGCDGNTKGIGLLVEGMYAEDIIKKLRGVTCGYKRTSCPDQLAQALEKELNGNPEALYLKASGFLFCRSSRWLLRFRCRSGFCRLWLCGF